MGTDRTLGILGAGEEDEGAFLTPDGRSAFGMGARPDPCGPVVSRHRRG